MDYRHKLETEWNRYPLITLSTRAQVEKKKAHTGTFAAAKRIIDREGVIGLYAGLESALFGITVTNFVYYYCRLVVKEFVIPNADDFYRV